MSRRQSSPLGPNDPRHGTANGYSNHGCRCEPCRAAKREEARRYRDANPEAEAARVRRWRDANPEKLAETQRRYREANPEICAASQRRWHEAHPGAAAEQARRWQEANPERYAETKRRYREHNPDAFRRWAEQNPERYADNTWTADVRKRNRIPGAVIETIPRLEIFERDGWECKVIGCLYPGVPVSHEVAWPDPLFACIDHVVPLSKGGAHERANLATAHLRCNHLKSDKAGIV